MVPASIIHDPIAQATWGLVGQSITKPLISPIAFMSVPMGLLWSYGNWFNCDDEPTTTWTDCTDFD